MKSLTTPDFWRSYVARLPEVKQLARKVYQLWSSNQFHPSLHFKKVSDNLWSVRISSGYRALALKKEEDYYWIWIGPHSDYDRLIG